MGYHRDVKLGAPAWQSRSPFGRFGRLLCVAISIASLVISTACVVGLPGARPTPRPQPVEASDLLLEERDLPEGWSSSEPYDDSEHFPGTVEALFVGFGPPRRGEGALHLVLRYRDAQVAAREYEGERSRWFRTDSYVITPWHRPSSLLYQSPVADQFECACVVERSRDGLDRSLTSCLALARYDEFISVFSKDLRAYDLQ